MTKPSDVLKQWIDNLKFFTKEVKSGFFKELSELIKKINNQPSGSLKFNEITKKYHQRIRQIPFPETPWYEDARIRDEEFGFMKLIHDFFDYYKPILEDYLKNLPKILNQEYPEYLSKLNEIDQDITIKLKKKSILKTRLKQNLMKKPDKIKKANEDLKEFVESIGKTEEFIKYETYAIRIKNSKHFIQSNYKKLASELSSKYENVRYANGFLLAIFDYLEGNPLDVDEYFRRKYNPNDDMYKKWKGNHKSLKEYLENEYPNLKKTFDWIHDNKGVMYYRHKFSHNRDDVTQDEIGKIKILDRNGENTIEEDIENIVGYTQNLWFILWILCLSNLLILEPIFHVENSINEFSTKFNEFKDLLERGNKKLKQYNEYQKYNRRKSM